MTQRYMVGAASSDRRPDYGDQTQSRTFYMLGSGASPAAARVPNSSDAHFRRPDPHAADARMATSALLGSAGQNSYAGFRAGDNAGSWVSAAAQRQELSTGRVAPELKLAYRLAWWGARGASVTAIRYPWRLWIVGLTDCLTT